MQVVAEAIKKLLQTFGFTDLTSVLGDGRFRLMALFLKCCNLRSQGFVFVVSLLQFGLHLSLIGRKSALKALLLFFELVGHHIEKILCFVWRRDRCSGTRTKTWARMNTR